MGGEEGEMPDMDMGEDGEGVRPEGMDEDLDYSKLDDAPMEDEPMQEGDSESHDSGDLWFDNYYNFIKFKKTVW